MSSPSVHIIGPVGAAARVTSDSGVISIFVDGLGPELMQLGVIQSGVSYVASCRDLKFTEGRDRKGDSSAT